MLERTMVLMVAVAMSGCRWGPPKEWPEAEHAPGFWTLVDAVAADDGETVRRVAGDLAPPDDAERLGAALGFLQVAADHEERLDALAKVTVACAACHAAEGVPGTLFPPARPGQEARLPVGSALFPADRSSSAEALAESLKKVVAIR